MEYSKDTTYIRDSQILEPEIDHVIDITNNESQNYIDPLEIATVSTEENDLDTISTKATVAPVNDLHNTPSHWNKLRNLVVVDENIPQTPIPSDLTSVLSKSSSKRDIYQGNALKMLRFKSTVQQRSDVNKMEKDLERLITRTYGGNMFTSIGGSGNSAGSLGPLPVNDKGNKQQVDILREDSVRSAGGHFNFLSELYKLLKRWKHVVKLPDSHQILSELAKPFYNYPGNADDCNQSLDIFEYIRATYRPADPDENFARIQWCCKLLETHHSIIRNRLCDITEKLLNATAMNSYFPTSVAAIHSLIYTFIHTLVVTASSNLKSEESNKLFKMVDGFLSRLAAGTLISIDPDEMTIGNARVQINKYDSLARCIFVEGLVKCLLVKDVQLCKYIMENLIGKYWITPDLSMQSLYEHIIQLFAQSAIEILADPNMSFIDSSNPYISLPYLILHTLNQNLPPKNLRSMPSHIVRSLVSVVVSIFALPWPDNNSQSSKKQYNLPIRSSSNNQKMSGNETDNETSAGDIDSKYKNTRPSLNKINDGLLTPGSIRQSSEIDILRLAKTYIEYLWNEGWKNEVVELVKEAFEQDDLDRIITIFNQLVFGISDSIGDDIVKETIPDLFAKIVKIRPEKSANLKKILLSLSTKYRAHFYKPILACVASDNESKVSEYLHLISTLLNYMNGVELFMQDVELMNVIILSDVGPSSVKNEEDKHNSKLTVSSTTSQVNTWGSTTVGQCAIIMEFIWIIRELRLQQSSDRAKDSKHDTIAKKFLNELEKRLSIFMVAKEKSKLIPMPLRVLLCNLFFEIRLYCWLSRIIDWTVHSSPVIHRDSMSFGLNQNPFTAQSELEADNNQLNEVEFIFQRIRVVYATLDDWNSSDTDRDEFLDVPVPAIPRVPVTPSTPNTPKTPITPYNDLRRSSTVVPSSGPAVNTPRRISSKLPKQRLHRFNTFSDDPAFSFLSLLVAVFNTIAEEEFTRLAPHLWNRFLNDKKHKPFASASFLFILCGEKSPETVKDFIMKDLYSTNALVRAITIYKISSLFGHRNQLLSQSYVSDSTRKRPFRVQAPAIPYIPTELGTQDVMMYESSKESKSKNSHHDVDQRIQELGWEVVDESETESDRSKRIVTPISLLSTFHLDEEVLKQRDEATPIQTARDKIRRNIRSEVISNMQGNTNKRRIISVHILSFFSLRLVDLLDDIHCGVYNLAKEIIIYFLRDDPLLFLRIFFSDLGTLNFETQKKLLTRIRFLISMQHVFPPGFTYMLFNHLAGILKWYSRDNKENGLGLMTYIIPTMAEMVPTVSNILVRDFKKNKIEHILCNNGQFWFTDGTPPSMFPRELTNDEVTFNILDVPLIMFQVAMLRVGHIHFMTNYVVAWPQEVYSVKKMIHAFAPTHLTDNLVNVNEEEKYFPDIEKAQRRYNGFNDILSRREKDIKLISALRARSWLNFLLSMLKRLNSNYNDRSELKIFLSGVNDILLEHANDFGIVGQTLVLYLTVITRFRRLFDTNRGYSIFIPALFKVFCESEKIPPIRSAITFAWYKFFQVHGESFIFQTLGSLTPIILKGSAKSTEVGEWLCSSLYELFKALSSPVKHSDSLGIGEAVDKLNITDPLLFDPPPLLNNTFRRRANSVASKSMGGLLGTQDEKIFSLEDLVRLFLTIIAYDPSSLRAEQFVQVLQYLIPHLLQESSSVRSLVDEGMAALTEVFLKLSKSFKHLIYSTINAENINETTENAGTSNNKPFLSETKAQAFGKQWKQNDKMTIKRQFLILIQAYKKYGGILSDNSHYKIANIIRLMLKDYAALKIKVSTNFIKDYIRDALLFNTTSEDGKKPILSFLRQMSASFRQNYKSIDFSGLIEGLVLITSDRCRFAVNDQAISFALKDKFVSFGLSVALKPDWEDEIIQLKLCNSIVKLFVGLMTHSDQDMLSELDKYQPSHQLMAYIVIPICHQYSPEEIYFTPMVSNIDSGESKAISCWIHLLAYITKACSRDSMMRSKTTFTLLGNNSRQNLDDDSDNEEEYVANKFVPSTTEAAATFIISFTALKIVLVRAEKYITQTKGMWIHINQFIRQVLGAAGTSQAKSGLYSLSGSPTASNTSIHINTETNDVNVDRTSFLRNNHYSSSSGNEGLNNTRSSFSSSSLDFVLWTFLELLLFYKLPLNLYLRTFIHQKLQNASTGVNSLNYQLSIDNFPRSPSLNSNTSNLNNTNNKEPYKRTRWKSWGGPPASFQRASLEKENGNIRSSILRQRSTLSRASSYGLINSNNEPREYQNITSPSGQPSRINSLINETLNAYSNVHTLMGYGNILYNRPNGSRLHKNDQFQELRAWSYKQVIDKLKEEKRIVIEAYKEAFNVLGKGPYFSNDSYNEMINNL
ncbi:21100_t:CDS:10 [Rhizophagus irregularis]|nr:21100_t:CDS:10 [Rhizophagus irregularis]